MVQLHNFFFFITFMVVPCGMTTPLLLKWFVSRDVPTGALCSNGTIIPIPIPIPSFPLLVYLHLRKFICSMDGAKSGVLVRASYPILLLDIIGRSSFKTRARNASFYFVPVLHFLFHESKLLPFTIQYETMECNGMDGRGLPVPKSDDSLVPLSIGTSWHTIDTIPTR